MEEKIVVAMEVEHATHRGGKAKPSSRDKCMMPFTLCFMPLLYSLLHIIYAPQSPCAT